MNNQEDCASVLEQFIYDGANLPAEISHMMEEIQAKDTEMEKHRLIINNKDANLQKNVKVNGVLHAHPKEAEYLEQVTKSYDALTRLQEEKVRLADRAMTIFDRYLKRFDIKLRDLASDGQLDIEGLPSTFNRKPDKSFLEATQGMPLQNASVSALNANAHRMNAQAIAAVQARQNAQAAALSSATPRPQAPTAAAAVQAQRQREREQSLGAEKRRKLGNPLVTANLPAQPSNLRQSSLGPGTPKAGTPTGTTGSRAGSVPRTTAAPQSATAGPKKSALSKKVLAGQQVKIKNKHTKHARLSSVGRKKTQSPSGRGGRAGTAASEEDSVLSSADASETDASQSRRAGRRKKQPVKAEVEAEREEAEPVDEEMEDEEDNTIYCLCKRQSFGDMVACENDSCEYQWFHIGCVGMKKAPGDSDIWYCPDCRVKPEVVQITRNKATAPSRK